MKKTKKAISLILAFAMIFTAMLGCMTVSSFAGTEGQSAEGPKLVDYSIEIGNDDPPTYSGSYFIVNLEFDKTIKVANDSWILNGFNISVSGSDLTSKNFQFKKFKVSDKTLSLYIETAPEKVAMLVNGRVDISLKSNYYDAIISTDGTQIPSDGWTDISTVVPTGLKFIPGDVNTGDDSSNASKTFAVEGKAIMRGATPVQIAIGDEVITVNIHTHSFIEQTNEDYAGILAKSFNDAVAEKEGFSYEMEADGSSVILKSKAQGADENIENAQVRTFEYTAPNDEIVQSAWLAETITSAEDRAAEIAESNSVAQSRKDALKDAIEKANSLTSTDMNCALDWQKAIAELQSAVDGAQDNAIETISATRSNGTVNLSLTGGEEWINNATIKLDGKALSKEDYSFSNGTLSISSLVFDTEGQTTPRTKSYTVSITADGYADVTQTVEVNFYGSSTFTIRLLDKNNKVVKTRTYTREDVEKYAQDPAKGGQQKLFSTACSMTGSRAFKGDGAYLSTLIEDAGITEGSDFNPSTTTVKFRVNDMNDSEINDDPTVDSYFSMINTPYEELMSPRYYFQDLYDHDSDLYKVYAESANIDEDDDDAVAEHNLKLRKAMAASEKVEVQPMVAYQFSEDPNVDLDDVPLSDPAHANYAYDPALAKDKSFRFLLGTGMTTENGQELSSTLNTTMRSTYQLYGIDLADSSIEVEDSGTIETTEAERSNGTVNLNLQGDGAWLAAIEENGVVKVDGVALSKENYTIADGVLKIASLKFGDAENTPRFKDYNIAIEVPGYAIATQTVKVKFYGASTFTIRLLDKNNKVVKSKTYTKEDIINYAQDSAKGGQQKLFSTACSMTGSRAFKGDGAYLSTLIEDAGIIEGSDFTPSTTTVKFRVNDMNDSEINDDPTIDSYFRMINTGYEELMSPRYYFQDLYNHDSDLYKVYAESANINKDDDDAVAEHNLKLRKAMAASEKVEVQPMVAYQFSEDPNVDLDDVPLSDPKHENCAYDQNLAADKGFRFLLGTGMVTDEETGEVLASTLNTTMRSTFQLYGIDLYDESLPASSSGGGGGGGGSAVTNYTVTFDSNGGSSVAKQTVASGKTASKPADPTKEGYTFGGWYTDKELTEAYDFGTTVKKSITLYAKWNEEGEEPGTEEPGTEPGTGTAGTFTDVAADSWYAEYVTYLADKGIVNGKTETTFEPNSNITRAEFIKIIAGVAGADVSGASSSKFSDVTAGSWYAPYVAWGVENGLINGVSDTSFNPNGRITRQDMATLISRYADFAKFELPQTVTPVEFADGADIASYAKDAVAEMQKAGIINGKDANRFAPEENATRAEACKMLTILMQQMGK